jgi:hypothetical protein
MKHTPYDESVLERMAPGALCAEGFLGCDHRELGDILAEDDATIEAAGTTHEQIAADLDLWLQTAMVELGRPIALTDSVTATWHEGMGRIPSPWPGDGVFPKGELELVDSRTGTTLLVTPLSIHLIAAHGFFQGRGTRYRLEPADLIAILTTAG